MIFRELTIEEFNKVCDNLPLNNYYQTSSWAKIKANTGWDSYYVGVFNDDKIVGASMILSKKLILNKKLFYAPRGFLLDFSDKKLLKFFTEEVFKFVKDKDGVLIKIDPLVLYNHRDMNGNLINDGFSNKKIYDELIRLGYKHKGFTVGYSSEAQFRWTYCLDINRSKDEIFKEMNQRCRRCIRKYEKYPLILKDVDKDNIDDFKAIMEHTAERQNHYDRSREYYLSLKDNLKDRVKLSIIYLDKKKFLDEFKDDKLYDKIKNEKEDMIPISAGVFIFDKERANYVYGGTYSYYMPLMAQYKLQMDMIYLAMDKGIPLYDFGGISGDFKAGTPNYGVYEFKRGFGGYVVEYLGEFDLIINKMFYNLYNFMYSFYRNLKKVGAKIKSVVRK